MKKLVIAVLVILAVLLVIGLARDGIIKAVVALTTAKTTGAPVGIREFSLGLFRHSLRINGLKIYNPKDFPKGVLVDIPKVNIDYDLPALLKMDFHIINADISLKEMVLVKNKDGKLNVDSLKVAKEKEPAKKINMRIDTLKLNIGKIVSKDYSQGAEPKVLVYDVNLNKTYKNITSFQQLTVLILVEPMKSAGIKSAGIYGVSMLAGVAVLPVAIAATFIGKDSAQQTFHAGFDVVFNKGLELLKRTGTITAQDKVTGVISANVNSANIAVKFKKMDHNSTIVTVSARKYLLPRPEIAAGILYQLTEALK